jgi:1-acyl-sn-glycerol-3-phosphate acyltransferase
MIRTLYKALKIIRWIKNKRPLLKKAQKLDKKGDFIERDKIVHDVVPSWAQYVAEIIGANIVIKGEENIPKDQAVVFIANHQGYADIIAILGFIDKPTAFMAKSEIKKISYAANWMELMQCTFLVRKNPRQSVQAMQEAIESVKKGYSLVIFPEGTRSKGGPIKEFKPGSFKLAFNSEAPIIPITIDGTWHFFEEHNRMHPGNAILTIHPPIYTKDLTKEERHLIPMQVQKTIESALPKTSLRNPHEIAIIEAKKAKKNAKLLKKSKKRK